MKRLLLLPIACSLVLSAYSMGSDPRYQNEWSLLPADQRYAQFTQAGGTLDLNTWNNMSHNMQYDNMAELQKQQMLTVQQNRHRQQVTPKNRKQPVTPSKATRFLGFMKSCMTTPIKFVWNNKERLALIAIATYALYNNYNGWGTLLKQYTPDKVQAFVDYCLNKVGLDMTTTAEEIAKILAKLQAEFDNSWFLYRWTHSRPMSV